MSHTEADRKAFIQHQADVNHAKDLAEWLQRRPEVGVLNKGNGKFEYYQIIDGETVSVEEFENAIHKANKHVF
jgi:hypothetical protein